MGDANDTQTHEASLVNLMRRVKIYNELGFPVKAEAKPVSEGTG
jgi:hypothetical protein